MVTKIVTSKIDLNFLILNRETLHHCASLLIKNDLLLLKTLSESSIKHSNRHDHVEEAQLGLNKPLRKRHAYDVQS